MFNGDVKIERMLREVLSQNISAVLIFSARVYSNDLANTQVFQCSSVKCFLGETFKKQLKDGLRGIFLTERFKRVSRLLVQQSLT